MSSFSINIKSIVTDFQYKYVMKLDEWMDICGYMKKQMSMNIDNPNQLITKIVEVFEKKALRDD